MLEAVIVIFSCAPTYFTCVFLILSLGLLRKNSFSFDQWLFWTNFNPAKELSVCICRETSCRAFSFSLVRQVFVSSGAGRDHGLDRHNSDLVFLSSSGHWYKLLSCSYMLFLHPWQKHDRDCNHL